jgi:hypothetical protein
MHVRSIIGGVQKEIQDIAGEDWIDPDYITTKLPTVSRDIAARVQTLDLNYDTKVVILPAVPANTTSLAAYQAENGLIEDLMLPKVLEWRLAGQTQMDWCIVPQVDKVIDTDTGTGEPPAAVESADDTVESYEWRGGIIYISPCSQSVDLRVRYDGLPLSLETDSDQQIAGLTNAYIYMVCVKILANRGGETSEVVKTYRDYFNRSIADFEASAVKSSHSKTTRLGGRRSGWGGNGPFTPPIVG